MLLRLTTIGLFLALCLCSNHSLTAQIILRQTSSNNDAKLWLGAQHQHTFSKSWAIQTSVQARLEQNWSLFDKTFIELEGTYTPQQSKLLQHFELGAGFRFLGINDIRGKTQGYKAGYRIYGLVAFKKEWKRWEVGYRLLYQDQNGLPRAKETVADWTQERTLRNRVSLGYNIKKWKLDPEIRAEIFYPFGSSTGFNSYRLGLGTTYKISKQHAIKFRLLYEQSLGQESIQRDFILVLMYQFKTKAKKKKKKK